MKENEKDTKDKVKAVEDTDGNQDKCVKELEEKIVILTKKCDELETQNKSLWNSFNIMNQEKGNTHEEENPIGNEDENILINNKLSGFKRISPQVQPEKKVLLRTRMRGFQKNKKEDVCNCDVCYNEVDLEVYLGSHEEGVHKTNDSESENSLGSNQHKCHKEGVHMI